MTEAALKDSRAVSSARWYGPPGPPAVGGSVYRVLSVAEPVARKIASGVGFVKLTRKRCRSEKLTEQGPRSDWPTPDPRHAPQSSSRPDLEPSRCFDTTA
jgi:hypothetical protein